MFGFETALVALKKGERVQRSGWNGKGMFVFAVGDGFESYWNLQGEPGWGKPLCPFLALKTADNKVVPWLASQTDILAEDWSLAE